MKLFNFLNKKKNLFSKKYIRNAIKNNRDIKWASEELKLKGYTEDTDKYNIILSALMLLYNNTEHEHDISDNALIIKQLANKEVLTPLRFTADEWVEIHENRYQNIRDRRFFRNKNFNVYANDAFDIKVREIYNCSTKKTETNKNRNSCFKGTIFETDNGVFTGRYFNKCFLFSYDIEQGFIPNKTYHIYCNKIQINNDSYIYVVNKYEPNFCLLDVVYNIDWKYINDIKGVKVEDIEDITIGELTKL